ncbi:MAG: putative dehydrogenase [Frankiales bacterium]|nr:putative dehydrogenase [Frankiales bacterium]
MRSRTALLVALPVLAGLLTALPAQGSAPCSGSRETAHAVSFDGTPSSYRGAGCTIETGFLTGETHLRVEPDGTLVQQPAQTVPGVAGTGFVPGAPGPKPQTQITPAGFAVSRDGGKSFRYVEPAGVQWVASDGAIHVDAATGRLYYYALSPVVVPATGIPVEDQAPAGYAHLLTSDDGGHTWFNTQAPGYVESENPRFTSGPTPRGGDQPVPGERVAYWCGNTVLFAYGNRDCWRTLDGGHTWGFRSTMLRRGVPVHAQCGGSEEVFNASDGDYPSAGPDGALWTLVHCGGQTYLARSTDEALTFPILRKVPAADELRVDSRGKLYAVSLTGTKLLLRTSRDAGRTWSTAIDLVAPARRGAAVGQWAMALRGPGQVAVAYLTGHRGGGYDGSVTVARGSALVSATVHDGRSVLVTAPQQAKDDYIDLDVAPDGSAWASFYGDCGKLAACAASSPNPMAKAAVLLHVG